jgi:hypothetical protein
MERNGGTVPDEMAWHSTAVTNYMKCRIGALIRRTGIGNLRTTVHNEAMAQDDRWFSYIGSGDNSHLTATADRRRANP